MNVCGTGLGVLSSRYSSRAKSCSDSTSIAPPITRNRTQGIESSTGNLLCEL
jgi:hypothetical protein